jgi:DNA-binding response OmpR family regulator
MRPPDLIVLDVMLPDGDGFLFAKKLRRNSAVPIIFLTARTSESDKITGFDVGGDDYVVKPFSPRELVLRVNAVLRRASGGEYGRKAGGADGGITGGEKSWLLGKSRFVMNLGAHKAFLDGTEISLTGAEWRIFEHLAENAGIVISRQRLLGELDYIAEGSERTIDTHIKNIRGKLGQPGWIETVRGFGYLFTGSRE